MEDLIIEGLSARQRKIADRLWKFDTTDEIDTFISKIPTRRGRIEARVVQHMMVAAVLDRDELTDLDEANHHLQAIFGR